MKQRSKVLTKTCASCDDVEINEENEFQCNWGDSKVPKILNNPKGRMKECKLIRGI